MRKIKLEVIVYAVIGLVCIGSLIGNVVQSVKINRLEEEQSKVLEIEYSEGEYYVTIDNKIMGDAKIMAFGKGKIVLQIGEKVYVSPIEKVVFE